MASLTFQNLIFFLGLVQICCIHISEILECLERHMSGRQVCRGSSHGPIEKKNVSFEGREK